MNTLDILHKTIVMIYNYIPLLITTTVPQFGPQ